MVWIGGAGGVVILHFPPFPSHIPSGLSHSTGLSYLHREGAVEGTVLLTPGQHQEGLLSPVWKLSTLTPLRQTFLGSIPEGPQGALHALPPSLGSRFHNLAPCSAHLTLPQSSWAGLGKISAYLGNTAL